MFKETMERSASRLLPSDIVEDVKHGLEVAAQIGYPVVLRPAYTLGGSEAVLHRNPGSVLRSWKMVSALSRVGQVLVEPCCIAGWKEIPNANNA